MKNDIWALYFHNMLPDEEANRGLCPTEENTWCRYNLSKIDGTHYSHKHSNLAHPDFICRCLHGTTQSPKSPSTILCGVDYQKLSLLDLIHKNWQI